MSKKIFFLLFLTVFASLIYAGEDDEAPSASSRPFRTFSELLALRDANTLFQFVEKTESNHARFYVSDSKEPLLKRLDVQMLMEHMVQETREKKEQYTASSAYEGDIACLWLEAQDASLSTQFDTLRQLFVRLQLVPATIVSAHDVLKLMLVQNFKNPNDIYRFAETRIEQEGKKMEVSDQNAAIIFYRKFSNLGSQKASRRLCELTNGPTWVYDGSLMPPNVRIGPGDWFEQQEAGDVVCSVLEVFLQHRACTEDFFCKTLAYNGFFKSIRAQRERYDFYEKQKGNFSQDVEAARFIAIKNAAEIGEPEMQSHYGLADPSFDGRDENLSNFWLLCAAIQGDKNAQFKIAVQYWARDNYSFALRFAIRSALQELAPSQAVVANILSLHFSDFRKAFEYWEKAAALGCVPAMYPQAMRLYYGLGIKINRQQATQMLKAVLQASDHPTNHLSKVGAHHRLGMQYYRGDGVVKRNLQQAKEHLLKVNDEKYAYFHEACFALGLVFDQEKKYDAAAERYQKAAEKGMPVAKYRLGRLYEEGLGKKRDMDEAIRLYTEAHQAGLTSATRALLRLGKVNTLSQADGRHLIEIASQKKDDDSDEEGHDAASAVAASAGGDRTEVETLNKADGRHLIEVASQKKDDDSDEEGHDAANAVAASAGGDSAEVETVLSAGFKEDNLDTYEGEEALLKLWQEDRIRKKEHAKGASTSKRTHDQSSDDKESFVAATFHESICAEEVYVEESSLYDKPNRAITFVEKFFRGKSEAASLKRNDLPAVLSELGCKVKTTTDGYVAFFRKKTDGMVYIFGWHPEHQTTRSSLAKGGLRRDLRVFFENIGAKPVSMTI